MLFDADEVRFFPGVPGAGVPGPFLLGILGLGDVGGPGVDDVGQLFPPLGRYLVQHVKKPLEAVF